MSGTNQTPAVGAPQSQRVNEDSNLVFSTATSNRVSMSDADAGSATVRLSISASNGAITLSGRAGLNFITGDGTADRSITIAGTLANINAALEGMTFRPDNNYFGSAAIRFDANDLGNTGTGGAKTSTQIMSLSIDPVNDAPEVAGDFAADLFEGQTYTFTTADLNEADVDDSGAGLTWALTHAPAHGTIWRDANANGTLDAGEALAAGDTFSHQDVIDGLLRYTHDNGKTAADSFSLTLADGGEDGAGPTAAATFSLTILLDNDAPENTVPVTPVISEDTDLVFSPALGTAITVADGDVGAGNLRVTLTAFYGTLTLAGTNGLVFESGDGTADVAMTFEGTLADINAALDGLRFTPDANHVGQAIVEIATYDFGNEYGAAKLDGDSVFITVVEANDVPELGGFATVLTIDDTATVKPFAAATVTDADAGERLIVTVAVDAPAKGVFTAASLAASGFIPIGGGAYLLLPATPEAAQAALRALDFAPSDNRVAAGTTETTTFTVRAFDREGASALQAGTLVVSTSVNDAPVLDASASPALVAIQEDAGPPTPGSKAGATLVSALLGGVTDADPAAMRGIAVIGVGGGGTLWSSLDGGASWSAAPALAVDKALLLPGSALLFWQPAADANGRVADAITFRAWDGTAGVAGDLADTTANGGSTAFSTATDTAAIDVAAVDDPGIARPDAFVLPDFGVLQGNVFDDNGFGADSDPDEGLVVTAVAGSAARVGVPVLLRSGATVTLNADGSFDYQSNGAWQWLPEGQVATDSFTYTLTRGATATVTFTIIGVDNDDVLRGSLGPDTLVGGQGDDTYHINHVGDRVSEAAGGGYDRAFASVNWTLSDWVERLSLTGAADLNGTGNDLDNRLDGNGGANVLEGAGGNDTLSGGRGHDSLTGGDGNDLLSGGLGNDSLAGDAGNDVLMGGGGANTMAGGAGNDIYYVDQIDDRIIELPGGGDDRVIASITWTLEDEVEQLSLSGSADIDGTGNDLANRLTGNAGRNRLDGGAGHDRLHGGAGRDTLLGGSGADSLDGGMGADELTGGVGADIFTFRSAAEAQGDIITDLNAGEGDRIDLRLIDAATTRTGDQAFTWIGSAGFGGIAGQLRFSSGVLEGDVDGDGSADFQIGLTGITTLASTSILL